METDVSQITYRTLIKAFGVDYSAWKLHNLHLHEACREAVRYGKAGKLPFAFETAAQGVAFARETGRLDGAMEITLRRLRGGVALELLVDVAQNITFTADGDSSCGTMADVSAYLANGAWQRRVTL